MKQFILDGVLQPEHKRYGLWLTEAPADASIINLILKGSAVASFTARTVTISEIIKTADKIMEEI